MFTFEELCELIRVVSDARVGSLEVEREGIRVRIEGQQQVVAAASQPFPPAPLVAPQIASSMPSVVSPQPAPGTASAGGAVAGRGAAEAPHEGDDGLAFVTSPIVGTFYRAPNPDANPYVKVGDVVEKGQVLCIVEAMKLMNEIESDTAGTIVKIYGENAQPVEFGERLFAIRPN